MADQRIVYGARCAWWDSIDKVGKTPPTKDGISLPCCPFCGSVLMELPNEAAWFAGVEKFEKERAATGYCDFIVWLRGKCFPGIIPALDAYMAATGKTVPNVRKN